MEKERKKILVVDDEPTVLEAVKAALETAHYEVAVAFNGRDGLQMAIGQQPDLILLDVMMPKMDGFQLLSCLKNDERTKRIPVVMLTAKGESESIYLSQQLRAADFLMKPFAVGELLDVVCRYIVKK